MERWLLFALLSALAAAFVGIFGKVALRQVDSTLATTLRSVVMTLFLAGLVTVAGAWSKVSTLPRNTWVALVLSGLAGALSWLFYFKAVQIGTVSQVAPIDKLSMPLAVLLAVLLLGDRPSGLNWVGIALVVIGAYLAAIPKTISPQ